MKVIILCGGTGTRLKEETEFRPKPMVYIGSKPILWHIMKLYSHYGFNDFILALGYKADFIKNYFLNQKALNNDFTLDMNSDETVFYNNKKNEGENFKITFVDTGLETLIGERILKCEKYVPKEDDDFMVTYGDGVANIDIKNLVEFHRKKGKIGTLTGVHPRSKFGLVRISRSALVEKFIEKPVLSDWVSGGFMIFKRQFMEFLRPHEMEHPAMKRLAKKNELVLYRHEGFWYAVDTFKELQDLNKIWAAGNPPWKVWK